MSYWRSYRKRRVELNNLARSSSSDDDIIHHAQSATNSNDHAQQDTESNDFHPDTISDHYGHDPSSELSFISSSDSEEEGTSFLNKESTVPVVSPQPFCHQLASWAIENRCQRSAVNDLLSILREQGHTSLPKDARTLLETPRVFSPLTKCGGQYLYFGVSSGISHILSKYPCFGEKHTCVNLKINVDGLPLFKSSSSQFWPILGSFNGLDVFVIALFYGNSKPSSVDEYLHDFLEEVVQHGLSHEGKMFVVDVNCFSCDAPARSFLKCITSHNGYYSCERCTVKGSWEGRVVFNSVERSCLRTDEQFANFQYEHHQKRQSPLIDHGMLCIQSFSLDYMHLVCLGVTKRILHFLRGGPRICKLSAQQLTQISDNLVQLHGAMPSEFARQPRTLKELDRWKATEFRQFLLYTGPVALRNVVSDEVYQHLLSLSVAISIMLDTNTAKRIAYLKYAHDLLEFFVTTCKNVYGTTFAVYNVHALLHLHEDINYFKCSLNEISCFPFENYMHCLKKLIRNANNPVVQVAKRLNELKHYSRKSSNKFKFTHVSSKPKDSCFILADNKFAFIKEVRDDGNLVCDIISEQHVKQFFNSPADSKLFNIVRIKDIDCHAKRCLVKREKLVSKAVCLPYRAGHVVFPLHHEVEKQ